MYRKIGKDTQLGYHSKAKGKLEDRRSLEASEPRRPREAESGRMSTSSSLFLPSTTLTDKSFYPIAKP
jgi:hypothetical protein